MGKLNLLAFIPEKISVVSESSHLAILWKDGRECRYDLLSLRRNCPCALCRGGHGPQSIRTTDHISQIQLLSWNKVGRYGLQLIWSDGHDTGIYTYDALRNTCEQDQTK